MEKLKVADLVPPLVEAGVIFIGDKTRFVSGIESHVYFNVADKIISDPTAKDVVVEALAQTYRDSGITADRLVGVPEGMTTLASSLTDTLRIGQLRVREKQNEHGRQQSIEGTYSRGQEVVVFEDVLTTAQSALTRAITPIQGAGLKPTGVVALIDREYGGISNLESNGIPAFAFATTTAIAEELVRLSAVNDQELRLLREELSQIATSIPY